VALAGLHTLLLHCQHGANEDRGGGHSSRAGPAHAQGVEEGIKRGNLRRTLYPAEENLTVWTGSKCSTVKYTAMVMYTPARPSQDNYSSIAAPVFIYHRISPIQQSFPGLSCFNSMYCINCCHTAKVSLFVSFTDPVSKTTMLYIIVVTSCVSFHMPTIHLAISCFNSY